MGYTDKEKQREYQRVWVAKRRQEFFSDKSCLDCGSTSRLELHHLDPKLKVSHKIWSWSEKRRLEEIAKCVILCYDCHKVRHEAKHGTMSRYGKGYWCKCLLCKEAKRKKSQEDRRKYYS